MNLEPEFVQVQRSYQWLADEARRQEARPIVGSALRLNVERPLSETARKLFRTISTGRLVGVADMIATLQEDKNVIWGVSPLPNIYPLESGRNWIRDVESVFLNWDTLDVLAGAEQALLAIEPEQEELKTRFILLSMVDYLATELSPYPSSKTAGFLTNFRDEALKLFQEKRSVADKWSSSDRKPSQDVRTVTRRQLYPTRASDRADLPTTDALGLTDDARALAELICLKDPGPPLAIGLFGDWGAGKSTFMAMNEDQAGKIADLERDAFRAEPDAAPPLFVQNVVHIRFNAWHYAEADLWSSLAAHIFRSLFEQAHNPKTPDGKPRPSWLSPEAFRDLLKDLARERAVEELAQGDADTAREAFARAKTEAREAKEHRDRLVKATEGDPKALLQLVTDVKDADRIDESLVALGHEPVFGDAARIVEIGQSMRSAKGRTMALLDTMSTPLCCYVALGFFFAAGIAGWLWWDGMREKLHHLFGVATVAGTVAAKLSALPSVTKNTARVALAGDKIMAAARDAQATAAADLKTAEADLDKAEVALEQARRRREGLEALADADNPEAALNAFLDARLGDGAYRDQLGVVSRLHDDFLALSRLLEAAERKHAEAMADPDTPADRRIPPQHLQRIVLYIDDLDRCPDPTVIKVLEAVHLLLALPLFVVVVGVDGRWLEGALEREYADQLGSDGTASPSDYLEKIFQLPYWLPRLDTEDVEDGSFVRLVNALAPEAAGQTADDEDASVEGAPDSHNATPQEGSADESEGGGTRDGEIVWVDAPELTAVAQREALREQVTLTKEELDCIKALGPMIGKSPRAVKRFMNSYRFLKARRAPGDEDEANVSRDLSRITHLVSLAAEVGLSDGGKHVFEAIAATVSDSSIPSSDGGFEVFKLVAYLTEPELRTPDEAVDRMAASFPSLFKENTFIHQYDSRVISELKRINDALSRLASHQTKQLPDKLFSSSRLMRRLIAQRRSSQLPRLTFRNPYR